MIAATSVPFNPAAPTAYLIADQRSTTFFNPTIDPKAGIQWEATASPLSPADLKRLAVMPGPKTASASLTPGWPFDDTALLWANIGNTIPGDQIVAFKLAIDAAGNLSRIAGQSPVWMDLSPDEQIDAKGWTMLRAPGVGTTPPTVPGSTATPPAVTVMP